MIKALWFSLLLVLTSNTAQAGIRVIYGGGGYGEMQALSALDQLNAYVEPLVFVAGWARTPYPMLSNLNEARFLHYAWRDGLMKTDKLVVEFAGPEKTLESETNLRIDPAALYETDGSPKSREEIFEAVFVARFSAKDAAPYTEWAGVSPQALRSLAKELVSKFEVYSAQAGTDDYMVAFTGLRLKDPADSIAQTNMRWIQGERVIQLDLELSRHLTCEIMGPFQVSKVYDLHVEDGRIHGRIEWICGARQLARGRIAFTPAKDGWEPAIKVTQIEYPKAVKSACDRNLTE